MAKLKTKALSMNMSEAQYIQHLVKTNRKIAGMAIDAGVSIQSIYEAMNRHNIKRSNAYEFDFQGVKDSFKGHCQRNGVNYGTARGRQHKLWLSKPDSITHVLKTVKDNRFEYEGVLASMTDHCKRLGLRRATVFNAVKIGKMTRNDALNHYKNLRLAKLHNKNGDQNANDSATTCYA